MSKRALRRHHRARVRRRCHRMLAWQWLVRYSDTGWLEHQVLLRAENFAVCSCWMCGNPRRYGNARTVQERRSQLDLAEGLLGS